VAAQKKNSKTGKNSPSRGAQALVIFWLVFIIVIIAVFMANAQTIKKNFNLFKSRMASASEAEESPFEDEEPVVQERPPARQETPAQKPATEPPKPDKPTPLEKPPEEAPKQTKPETQPPAKPPETRDRNIYFAQIDKDGQILQSKVSRKIAVSDSPMLDSLNVLLAGPTASELNKNLLNFIPQNTRILSATVRSNTAYINFNEDFLFNKFGVEGYVAQLRQIVWTVTEFSNVKDVQILVEGRRLDYLGEGIWIGSPINRQSF